MASPARFAALILALRPSSRFAHLFSLSDRQLAARGYDRGGLTRSYIGGISGF